MSIESPSEPLRVAILGPGSVGGFLGIALGAGGAQVRMVYRPGRVEGDSADCVIDRRGATLHRPDSVTLGDDPRCLDGVDVVLVCVKAHQMSEAAEALARGSGSRWIISLQNGLESARELRDRFGAQVLPGVVTFNVSREPSGVRRQANRGGLLIEDRPAARPTLERLSEALERARVPVTPRTDIDRVRAGKLLLNLNNGVSAATGLSISELLASRDARWCVAACLREGDRILRAGGHRPARVGLLSARGIARTMALPGAVLAIGGRLSGMATASTRPSTLQDLDRGRPTEIAALNGAIVEIAERVGRRAPANAAVTDAVREHERAVAAGARPTYLSPASLRARIEG